MLDSMDAEGGRSRQYHSWRSVMLDSMDAEGGRSRQYHSWRSVMLDCMDAGGARLLYWAKVSGQAQLSL